MPGSEIIDSYSLSPMQKAMFVQSWLSPDSGMYLLQLEGEFLENLDTARFWEAWRIVIDRHTILRTTFHVTREGEPYQVVHSHVDVPVIERDLRGFTSQEQEAQIHHYLQTDWQAGFDLAIPPLLRLGLFQLEDESYFFVRTIHHLLSDSWSSLIQYKEVFMIYDTLRAGSRPVLPSARKYREYVDWLSTHEMPGAQSYWRERLAGFGSPTPLPLQKNRDYSQAGAESDGGYQFGSFGLRIPSDSSDKLRAFVSEHGFTLNNLLQGAWAILLSRYSGEKDILFGGTRNCRKSSFAEARELVGPMVNTLPVRARLEENSRALSLLHDLKEQWLSMRPFEHTSLTSIAGWSDIPHGERIFESVVNFDHLGFNAALRSQSKAWETRSFKYRQNPGYPLALNGFGEKEFTLLFYFDRSQFADESIARMAGNLETILQGMVDHPEDPLDRLPILSAAERYEILYAWNDTRVDFENKLLVHQSFEQRARENPDRIAVVIADREISYGQLNLRANQLSAYLVDSGVTSDRLVGIYMPRSIDAIVAMLGILKAGGAYLPLDPDLPPERLATMVTDAQPVLVLAHSSLESNIDHLGTRVTCLDRDWDKIAGNNLANPEIDVGSENLVYVIYTSGSSGKPKGVEITHAGLRNLVNWHIKEFSITNADRALQIANLSFDASVWELWPYLASGAQIHLLASEIDLAPERLLDWIERDGITIAFLPTPVLESALEINWPETTPLRFLLTGGDRLHSRPAYRLPFRLINNYGPTECTVVTTSGEVYPQAEIDDQLEPAAPDIGRPIDNVSLYVLDRNLNPVPVGVPGELYIGGAGIGRGYLNQPELTSLNFIKNPFDSGTSSRLYRSGDLVRFLPDGRLEYLGRGDQQVKIRGVRIELGEIESLLMDHPEVARAAVLQVETGNSGRQLVAYVEGRASSALDSGKLTDYLQARLPSQVLPAIYVFIDEFPLTSNQKIDREALAKIPLPASQDVFQAEGGSVPRSALETAMVGLWSDVLGTRPIGLRDNFFERGGNSLVAIRLISQVNDIFNIDLPLKVLFEKPTIQAMTSYLESEGNMGTNLERIAEIYLHIVQMSELEAARLLEEKMVERQVWGKDANFNG